jgi:hypothetical protein
MSWCVCEGVAAHSSRAGMLTRPCRQSQAFHKAVLLKTAFFLSVLVFLTMYLNILVSAVHMLKFILSNTRLAPIFNHSLHGQNGYTLTGHCHSI